MTLFQVEMFLNVVDDELVGGFRLAVSLWVTRGRGAQTNVPFAAKLLEVARHEL